jgi:hypothetical protein
MPGHAAGAAPPEATATVATAIAAAATASAPATAGMPPVAAPASRTPWLWAALLAGLAVMAAMAWSLLRQPADQAADKAT